MKFVLFIVMCMLSWPVCAQSIAFSPASPSITCGTNPGTVISTATLTGGPAGALSSSWTVSGDTVDFSPGIPSLNSLPITVISGGITPGSCNTTQTFIVTVEKPSQPGVVLASGTLSIFIGTTPIACSNPPIPHPAQAAGFTTLAYCADFTQQSVINNVLNGTSQIVNWTSMNWLDCNAGHQGAIAGKQWYNFEGTTGNGQNNVCGAKTVALDTASGSNSLQITAITSYGLSGLGISTAIDPCSDTTNACYEVFPVTNLYAEINWRISTSEFNNNIVDKGNSEVDFWAWFADTTQNNACGVEIDFIETFNLFPVPTGYGNRGCGGSLTTNRGTYTIDSNYHKDGTLVTANGLGAATTVSNCGYHDDVVSTPGCSMFTGTSPFGPTRQQGYLFLSNLAAHVNAVTGPVHLWIAWIRIWSCAGWNTTGNPSTTSNTCNTTSPYTSPP